VDAGRSQCGASIHTESPSWRTVAATLRHLNVGTLSTVCSVSMRKSRPMLSGSAIRMCDAATYASVQR
jgi:hypothetical protein